MAAKNNNALFYTCSLIEYIGRTKKETRCKIVEDLGKDTIQRIIIIQMYSIVSRLRR